MLAAVTSDPSFYVALGVACVIAAIAAGVVKVTGLIEIPGVREPWQQILLGLVGILLIVGAGIWDHQKQKDKEKAERKAERRKELHVTKVVLVRESPEVIGGECPATFEFSAIITLNGRHTGDVVYRWKDESGGAFTKQLRVHFKNQTAKTVSNHLDLDENQSGMAFLEVQEPDQVESNHMSYRSDCG